MSKEIKPLGYNIDLKGLVVHQVNKIAGTRKAVPKVSKKQLVITDREIKFIAKVDKSYFTNSRPTYGIFADENPDFKNSLTVFNDNKDFYSFSVNALNQYKSVLANTVSATGGFLIFAHYFNTDRNSDYMLVMTINNKDGYFVSKSLKIQDIKNLDLSKVDVACIINLTKWKEIEDGKDITSKTYLSFAKGNKSISYYFLSFIDCNNKTTATDSTKRFKKALEDYCESEKFDRETKIEKRNLVFNYCLGCLDGKKEIQLSVISALLDPESPSKFEVFASNENYGVSPIINGDRARLKLIRFVSYKDKQMTIEFDCELLTSKKVVFDKAKSQLILKDIPQKLIDQIPM